MAPPSKISRLPQDLRDELNRRILANGFAGYDELEAWLNAELEKRGLAMTISRSAIHREGRKLEELGERVRAMRMLQESWQKQMGARGLGEIGRVLNAQLQGLAFALTQDVADGGEIDAEWLRDMSATIMRLERAASLNEEREQKIREEERKRAREEAAEAAAKSAKSAGLSEQTIQKIRRDVLGLA